MHKKEIWRWMTGKRLHNEAEGGKDRSVVRGGQIGRGVAQLPHFTVGPP